MTLLPPEVTALDYRHAIADRQIGAEAGIERFLHALRQLDARVQAVLECYEHEALTAARVVDRELAQGRVARPLEGVPFTVKGNLSTEFGTTNAGSRILEGFRALADATAVRRLRAAGAILVAKTNLDEFGMGSSCENSAFHPTRNPWNKKWVPGGSSGGAAALAAGLGGSFHLGTDTGGSIRQPAAFCHVTGMKPSYGAVSRAGVLAFGSSLDQVGVLGRSAADARAVLAVMGGHDALDATSRREPTLTPPPAPPWRVGLPREYFASGIDPQVTEKVRAAVGLLEALGCVVVEVSLPHTEYANACYQIVSTAEASSNLARYDGIHYGVRTGTGELAAVYRASRGRGFGAEVQRRILLGTFVLTAGHADAYYQRALRVRSKIREDFERVFRDVDVLVAPTSPVLPFALGERVTDPLALYACDVLTVPASLAGLPGVSVPCGRAGGGEPVGLQILGPVGGDSLVLAVAEAYQARSDHHRALAHDPTSGNGGAAA
ncbi:MAG: Asp-tRNA(Asn)/Glu-tRNA(Gln) amidotransferase subunit GatA [Planctomycetota bacterium]